MIGGRLLGYVWLLVCCWSVVVQQSESDLLLYYNHAAWGNWLVDCLVGGCGWLVCFGWLIWLMVCCGLVVGLWLVGWLVVWLIY